MGTYSIRDLENISGIQAHTIRAWEQRYSILKPKRSDTNIRSYDDVELKLLLNIALLNNSGVKISKIAKLHDSIIIDQVKSIQFNEDAYPLQIQSLTIAMLNLDEEHFDNILEDNIDLLGFETVMINIIYPFLKKIGILWITDTVGPAQEHFMINLIRQKLLVAIEKDKKPLHKNHKTFVLYLPEGEFHEISLMFTNYFLRSRGQKVIYLGQSLPMIDLKFVCDLHKPDFVFSVLTSSIQQFEIQNYVDKLALEINNTQILLTGYQVLSQSIRLPSKIKTLNDINALLEYIPLN